MISNFTCSGQNDIQFKHPPGQIDIQIGHPSEQFDSLNCVKKLIRLWPKKCEQFKYNFPSNFGPMHTDNLIVFQVHLTFKYLNSLASWLLPNHSAISSSGGVGKDGRSTFMPQHPPWTCLSGCRHMMLQSQLNFPFEQGHFQPQHVWAVSRGQCRAPQPGHISSPSCPMLSLGSSLSSETVKWQLKMLVVFRAFR